MKRFKNFFPVVLTALGLTEFRKNQEGKVFFDETEKETLKTMGFTDEAISGIEAEANQPDETEDKAEESKANAIQAAVVRSAMNQISKLEQEKAALEEKAAKEKEDYSALIKERDEKIAGLNKQLATLSELPDTAQDVHLPGLQGSTAPKFDLSDTKQLGGMPGEMFGLDRAYNRRARAALLANQGMMLPVAMATPQDFSTLKDDLGAFYRTQWRDRIQSLLAVLPSIEEIFPMEAGHQDLDTLVNVWFGEFSQADSSGESDFEKVKKGTYQFGTETLRMYGVMFVHVFQDLKQLEKLWIGYLNREGSNPVKLSFIEFLLAEISKVLHNEQQMRLVNGVRVNPNPNEPGRAMEAADGIYEYIRKRIDGHTDFTPDGGTTGKTVYQIKPFELPAITPGNIGEVFYLGTSMIPAQYRDTGMIRLYVPALLVSWYHKYNETHYGQNRDYNPKEMYVHEFPNVKIVPIPNADHHRRIFWTVEGNIKTYCQIAGEMYNFTLEQQDWRMKAWSNWKESIQAEAVGFKYTDPAEMDGSRQLIWANNEDLQESYFVEMKPDTNPSARLHTSMQTVANNGTFTITDITDAPVGKVLTLKCGEGGENGVKINKSGNFSLLSAAWTPAKGEVIKLMKRSDGKFIEISRGEVNDEPAFQFEANDTTPSVAGGTVFVTGANTEATAITDLKFAVPGVVYTIFGSGSTNASTIANGGNFVLTAAMTLSDGKQIKLVKAGDGKFYELSRN